jgi:hypothetical protein
MQMIRWFKQLWCAHRGHPYPTIAVPDGGAFPPDPKADQTFCRNCRTVLHTEFTDNGWNGTDPSWLTLRRSHSPL